MSDPDDNAEDDGKLDAAEYVLGVLSVAERREIERRLAREPELAREVAFWEERLGSLTDATPPVPPPDDAWSRIETTISAPAAPSTSAPASTSAPTPTPAAKSAASAGPAPRVGLWSSLAFWRGVAVGSAALAVASFCAVVYLATTPAPRTSPLLAMLGQTSGQPGFVAAIGADGKNLLIVPAALLAQDQRSLELWVIPAGDKPHSLGLIAAGQPVRVDVPPNLVKSITTDATLAVTLEPLGGSPTGDPTGPVVASGKLTRL